MSSLGNEICKNILLAGIKHLTILDDKPLTENDFDSQFFSPQEDIGKNVSQLLYFINLNPFSSLYCQSVIPDSVQDGDLTFLWS